MKNRRVSQAVFVLPLFSNVFIMTEPTAVRGQSDAGAEEFAPTAETHGFFDLDYKYMTGDWGGVREDLDDAGVRFKIQWMNQIMFNAHGGLETKNGLDTAGSVDFNVYLDLEKLLGIPDATFWIRPKGTWGGDDSDFDKEKIGGLFKTNNDASSEEPIFVDKWHWQQFFFDKKLEFRFGRQEPVKDLFDTSEIMGSEDAEFLNRALVINGTIPSSKGLSAFLRWYFVDNAYLSTAVFDAQSRDRQTNFNTAFHDEDLFRFYAELGYKPKLSSTHGDLPGHYRIGTWYDPTEKVKFRDTLGGLRETQYDVGDWGYYFGFDQMVWKENEDPDDEQGISIAGRYGHADGEVNTIEDFWSVAAQYQGAIPSRDADRVAFGVGQGILADEIDRIRPRADRETVYELYYSFEIAPWLTISPDLQYITNAGGDADDDDAFVAGLRVRMIL